MPFRTTTTVGTGIQTYIDTTLVTNGGWTKTTNAGSYPFTYSNASVSGQDRLVKFQISAVTANYMAFTALDSANNVSYHFIVTGATSLSGTFTIDIACGPNNVYIGLRGPTNGAGYEWDATYGSGIGFFAMAPVVPYFSTDTVKNDQVVAMSSHATSSITSYNYSGYVAKTRDSASVWGQVELGSLRPSARSTFAAPVSPFNNVLTPFWPYTVHEVGDGRGLRGRLDGLYFATDNYATYGAPGVGGPYTSGVINTIDGALHVCVKQTFFIPNTNDQYSPLGTPVRNGAGSGLASGSGYGGPTIAVRI